MAEPMKTYHLAKSVLFLPLAALAILLLVVLAVLLPSFLRPGAHPPPLFLGLVWVAVLVIFFFSYLRVPYAITWMADDFLEFRGPLLRTLVPVSDIISIKALPVKPGFIKINHRRGSIRLINQITGLYELIGRIKALNPGVEIKGC